MTTTMQNEFAGIAEKLEASQPLSFEEGLRLYESPDIHTLGELANGVRERLHGRDVFFNINRHINYTNYCVLRCKFCSFYRPYAKEGASKPLPHGRGSDQKAIGTTGLETGATQAPLPHSRGSDQTAIGITGLETGATQAPNVARAEARASASKPLPPGRGSDQSSEAAIADDGGGYELSIDEIVGRAKEAYARGATEVHIVGGLHPKLPFSYYIDMCEAIRDPCPHMHIKAFTAIEIIHFTRISKPKLSIAEVLTQLQAAGLGSLPGGGAEIFDDRVHEEAFQTKVGEAEWFEVHQTAHELGIFTNATMLYGHVETPAERIRHLIKLREHQEESLRSRQAHFNCVIPLSFVPEGSDFADLPGPCGLDDLKTLAIARLMCPNIPHIKAFWIMLTPKLAQVSLNWGVDDIDGTVVYYDITKRDGGTHQELSIDKLRRLIVEAGCRPVERDTVYRRVVRNDNSWSIEGESWSVPYDPRATRAASPLQIL